MTNDAVRIVDPTQSISLTANFYFGIASSLLLIVVCSVITDRVVEPRLGAYHGDAPAGESQELSAEESRGLACALWAVVATLLVLCLLTLPRGAPLRHPTTGEIFGESPFMSSLVVLVLVVFLAGGIGYGIGARTFTTIRSGIDAVTGTLSDLGGLLFLFFVISQFVAYFNYSNMGMVLAVKLAHILQAADLGRAPLLVGFIVIGYLLSIPFPTILPKWAMLAPVFVPLFMKLGVAPDAVLAAYRVSESPPNVINPLLPYFALVVGFAQRWQKDAGVGTVMAMMLPYSAATFVAGTLLFFAWYVLGLPFGPG